MTSFTVTYKITIGVGERLNEKLRNICLEQSVELPDDVIEPSIRQTNVGHVVSKEQLNECQYLVDIAWPLDNVGTEVHQLINMLFGNISMQQGIQIVDMEWSKLNHILGGPAFGITGIRSAFKIFDRPLSATALKPLGYSVKQLAKLCFKFALGGIDIIKDDHNLADQKFAPFKQRVVACVNVLDRAAQKTGKKSFYFTNVTGDYPTVMDRVKIAIEAGADGIMVAPHICGLSVLSNLRSSNYKIPIIVHPAFAGSLFMNPRHGISAPMLIGGLWRALGADFVIYPNIDGRFSFTEKVCRATADFARNKHIPFRQAFPMPGGGIQRNNVNKWVNLYGKDLVLLIGGSLYQHPKGVGYAAREIQAVLHQN